MTPIPDMMSRKWWVFVLRGAIAILFGMAAWVWPGLTVAALVILFGAYALVDGFFAVAAGVTSYGHNRRWWSEVLVGIAGIVVGVLTFLWPGVTALALLYIIAAWALVTGGFEIAAAIQLREEISNEWFLGLGGLASILFGLLLLIFPGSGATGLVWLIGVYAITFGVMLVALGFRLRSAPSVSADRMSSTAVSRRA